MEKTISSLPSGFEGLIALVRILRSENGCPWDREQTPEQIKMYLLEESYEVVEALESEDPASVCDELGDLLFHIFFLARFFEEAGQFTIWEVLKSIVEKMVRRHPHVFADVKVNDSEEVRQRWHEIKMAEAGEDARKNRPLFASVPRKLPALMRAYRIAERASKLGLYRAPVNGLLKTLDQRLSRLKVGLKLQDRKNAKKELGDLMFILVNIARSMNVHPEAALTGSVREFIRQCERAERKPTRS